MVTMTMTALMMLMMMMVQLAEAENDRSSSDESTPEEVDPKLLRMQLLEVSDGVALYVVVNFQLPVWQIYLGL